LALALLLPAVDSQAADSGTPAWTNRFGALAGQTDGAVAIATDPSGNVVVAGFSWTGASHDYVTVKYSALGVALWTNRYDGPGQGDDFVSAVVVDGSGKVWVTGNSAGSETSDDYATVAYSSAGVPLWTNRFDGSGNFVDRPSALGVDAGGNAFVTGQSFSSGGSFDFATVAYSGAGVPLWTNRYTGLGDDQACALVVDGDGRVAVTGYSEGSTTAFATVLYSGAGVPLWTNRSAGPLKNEGRPGSIGVDASGNVFVAGYVDAGANGINFQTLKYSPVGVPAWTNRYDGPGAGTDSVSALAVDSGGNVIVTGGSVGTATQEDYATIKYSGAGVPLWTNRYNGTANGSDIPTDLVVDASGNVVVTGASWNGSNFDFVTVAYSSAGTPLWTNRCDGSGNGNDLANALAVDTSGNIYVTGQSWNGSDDDFLTVAYAAGVSPFIVMNDGNFGFQAGVFGFHVTGQAGQTVVIEGSTNLPSWQPLKTNLLGGGTVYFSDPASPGLAGRFYRLRVP
jgi:hypothetical protein